MNQWRSDVEVKGVVQTKEGVLKEDKYAALISTKGESQGVAHVSVTWGRTGPYGDPKVSAMVSLACDQNTGAIDTAGFLAYEKALEIVTEITKDFEAEKEKGT